MEASMFLKNAWYVAAWGSEITNDLQQILVLGEKICVFRNEEGEVIALEDGTLKIVCYNYVGFPASDQCMRVFSIQMFTC